MVFAWTKQFLMATGLFALVLTRQTVNMVVKEKRIAETALKDAHRTVSITTVSQIT
jgi:uncharacterized membrane protein